MPLTYYRESTLCEYIVNKPETHTGVQIRKRTVCLAACKITFLARLAIFDFEKAP